MPNGLLCSTRVSVSEMAERLSTDIHENDLYLNKLSEKGTGMTKSFEFQANNEQHDIQLNLVGVHPECLYR
jgi:hypothetical protein